MRNAAISIYRDAIDTSRDRLMGRHAAGESFMRGFLRHADVEQLYFYNGSAAPTQSVAPLIERIQAPTKPIRWISMRSFPSLAEPGCLYYPGPNLPMLARQRQPFGSSLYSLCGITHTTASLGTMDIIADLLTSPTEPWDGLITTSRAVRASVERELEATRAELAARLGATRFPQPQIATIPLGVNVEDFARSDEHRAAWRARLDIPADAIVVLYVGRLHMAAKMNPAAMAMALEETAQRTGKPIYWVVSGWGSSDAYNETHHAWTQALCPSVHYRTVDGRPADTRFSIWSVADLFISFSDNVQETFGLTPVEAMAAGLPAIVSDWDGYKDTVRHGLDGYRVRTYAPRPGVGGDLAYQHANGWMQYELYLVSAAQMTTVDLTDAVEALVALVENPDLRRRMGETAQAQARAVFDWSNIIPQYQAFWGELAERRDAAVAGGENRSGVNPRRLDPFDLFEAYPSEVVTGSTLVSSTRGMTWDLAQARLSGGLATIGNWPRPNLQEMQRAFEFLRAQEAPAKVADVLALFPAGRRPFVERGLPWLAKFGVIRIQGAQLSEGA